MASQVNKNQIQASKDQLEAAFNSLIYDEVSQL